MLSTLDLGMSVYNAVWGINNSYIFSSLLRRGNSEDAGSRSRTECDLPKISVLVPAYHEEKVLGRCLKAIFDSDYPADKLEVIVLLEKDDSKTISVVKEMAAGHSNLIPLISQEDKPRGKPYALNKGLKISAGSVIGVLDAEDMIDRSLFRNAARHISEFGQSAVQGVLDMINDRDGWKNMMMRAEYGHWFRRMLPSLASANYPFPFGGSTNFLRRDVLESLEGWDPANLTEDFDLGIRLFDSGLDGSAEVGMVESITKEESPTTWRRWMGQRTRWQQGKIQTFRKILHDPPKSIRNKFHAFMAAVQPHASIINITGIAAGAYELLTNFDMPEPLRLATYANMAALTVHCSMQSLGYLESTKGEHRRFRRLKSVMVGITTPAYWVMQWVADIRAMKLEYVDNSKEWYKTPHEGRNFYNGKEVGVLAAENNAPK
jgi:cellulose synthase/poly-beta-1,6-N-acetylglucosamine synthase-like glycosyltransferase